MARCGGTNETVALWTREVHVCKILKMMNLANHYPAAGPVLPIVHNVHLPRAPHIEGSPNKKKIHEKKIICDSKITDCIDRLIDTAD